MDEVARSTAIVDQTMPNTNPGGHQFGRLRSPKPLFAFSLQPKSLLQHDQTSGDGMIGYRTAQILHESTYSPKISYKVKNTDLLLDMQLFWQDFKCVHHLPAIMQLGTAGVGRSRVELDAKRCRAQRNLLDYNLHAAQSFSMSTQSHAYWVLFGSAKGPIFRLTPRKRLTQGARYSARIQYIR
jgi:hypothetical protein